MRTKMGQNLIAAALGLGLAMPVMAADTIKLGVAGAHSGDLASYGLPSVNAAKLVVADINAKGGINGKKVELLVEDDRDQAGLRRCGRGARAHLLRRHQGRAAHLQQRQGDSHVPVGDQPRSHPER